MSAPAISQYGLDQTIRELIEKHFQAIRDKRADDIAALYAHNATVFGLAPPLQEHGSQLTDPAGVRGWLDTWDGPLEIELRDLTIVARLDLAVAYALERLQGTLRGQGRSSTWLRTTMVFVRDHGEWRLLHVHDSVPVAMDGSAKALPDLKP